jgi:hypothetical protein
MLHPTCSQKLGSLSHCFGSYWVGGGELFGCGLCVGGTCRGDGGVVGILAIHCHCCFCRFGCCHFSLRHHCHCYHSWLAGLWLLVSHRACQDGSGPHASGHSGSGMLGWRRRATN